MFGGNKIKVSAALMEKLKRAASLLGVVSVDEFVNSLLERECDKILTNGENSDVASGKDVEEIARKLKGLGYLE